MKDGKFTRTTEPKSTASPAPSVPAKTVALVPDALRQAARQAHGAGFDRRSREALKVVHPPVAAFLKEGSDSAVALKLAEGIETGKAGDQDDMVTMAPSARSNS